MHYRLPDSSFQKIAKQLYANLKDKVTEFFEEHPNPSDEELHSWAEDEGYDPHEIEELVYAMATEHMESEDEDDDETDDDEDSEEEEDSEDSEEEIEGGLADGKDPEKYDLDQLLKGIEVEFEHTDKPEQALEIAMDHLEEDDDYYDDLEEMEKEGNMRIKGLKRIARKVKAQEWAGDSGYLEQVQNIVQDVQEGVQDYGEDVESAIESHASRVLGDYRLALQILQNSASVDREALQQLAYEALKADISQGM